MSTQEIKVPDIGTDSKVDVIEILVKPGDQIKIDDPIVTLESDKASMDVPATAAGIVKEVKLKVGDKVGQGDLVITVEAQGAAASAPIAPAAEKAASQKAVQASPVAVKPAVVPAVAVSHATEDNEDLYAGPAVRRLTRELGIELEQIVGTGRKGRIQLEDVHNFVKPIMQRAQSGQSAGGSFALPAAPSIDHSKFGEIEVQALSKIQKISGANLQRNWITVPHVTQFDEADMTELEDFRKAQNEAYKAKNIKITPLAFIMKAVVAALKAYPTFNASLSPAGDEIILKKYYHIGVAVDTPNGLVVAVIRDVDKKGIITISEELAQVSNKARTKGLSVADMQGSSFTISSLGGIGGTSFTPIVNLPDVAILGVSKAQIKPVYQDGTFVPRLMLPLSLSYDHRVIDGAAGARFTRFLADTLSDIRTLIM